MFGSIWFGDARNIEVGWIDSVAKSVAFVSGDRLTPAELGTLNNAEMLSRLNVTEPHTE